MAWMVLTSGVDSTFVRIPPHGVSADAAIPKVLWLRVYATIVSLYTCCCERIHVGKCDGACALCYIGVLVCDLHADKQYVGHGADNLDNACFELQFVAKLFGMDQRILQGPWNPLPYTQCMSPDVCIVLLDCMLQHSITILCCFVLEHLASDLPSQKVLPM